MPAQLNLVSLVVPLSNHTDAIGLRLVRFALAP
jgi:hypothetical protein